MRALLILSLLIAAPAAAQVRTAQGELAGVTADGVTSYKGVPFAASTAGKRRWEPPAAPAAWQGVRKAEGYGPICPQPAMPWGPPSTEVQSEDCLNLNIWTPAQKPSAKLPVMVWIHGGAYVAGSGTSPLNDGTRFAKQGVVLVTLNYRLGILGFYGHPELTREAGSSGNYGLMDQIAALQWVKANIAAFGGDPGNVTIFGESAGGGSVMLLTVSPKARGLFHKAIVESGAALPAQPRGWARPDAVVTLTQQEAAGTAFAAKIGAPSLAELRALPFEKLLAANPPQSLIWPTADGTTIPDDVTKIYRAGRQLDVPVLLGWNSNEGLLFSRPQSKAEYEKGFAAGYGPLAGRMAALYPAASDAAVVGANALLFGDVAFGWPGWSLAEAQAKTGKAPVFVYHFDQAPPRPAGFPFQAPGAFHADEIAYVFGNFAPDWPAADRAVSRAMQAYWVNFARTGSPNGAGLPAWQPYGHGRTVQWFQKGEARPGPMPRDAELKQLDEIIGG